MLLKLCFIVMLSGWCSAQTLPVVNPTVPFSTGPTIPSVPTVYPFGVTPGSIVPGVPYSNPYYNPTSGPAIPILTYSNEHAPDGSYSYSFSTADGKQAQETGYLKDAYIDNLGEPQGTQVVQGSYAYVAPDGTPIQVSYVADENGFRPSGVHIPADAKAPVLPPILEARKDGKQVYDPNFNRYNPYNYNYRNGYNNFGRYNPLRPYNARYPYDPKYHYNGAAPYNSLASYNGITPYNGVPPYNAYGAINKGVKEPRKN